MRTYFQIFRNFVLFTSMIFCVQNFKANAAQPGIWSAGGNTFTMLYPEDSASFKKVQMQSENIFVQLYKGFAVVKGVYYFRNHSKEKLNFKMGYPVNGIFSGGDASLNQITIDSLSSFKIFSNEIPIPILREPKADKIGNFQSFSENWHVWNMEFLPEEIKKVEVFFIVPTNDGGIRKGYSLQHYNAFLYLLESGSVWKNPIENGNFYIQLKDGLTIEGVHGLSENFNFKYNAANQIFWGSKTNFSPTPKDNLAITYFQPQENFDFGTLLKQEATYESAMKQFSALDFTKLLYEKAEIKNPYEVSSGIWGYVPAFLLFMIFVFPFILLGIAAIFLGYMIYRNWKSKKQ